MIAATTFAGRLVAVFGLGGSGVATAQALLAGGAVVAAWDDSEAARANAVAAGVPLLDLTSAEWRGFAALVLSPGVPLTHPRPHWTVGRAREAGVEVIGDIEIFCRERRHRAPAAPFVAITGTNGKSTTTALIAHILRTSGRDVQLGGNIGTAILSLQPPGTGRYHVVECSSYQIDLAPTLDPSVGVLLNISPDHIDRHGDVERYAAIKERLVAGADTAVIGVDDDRSATVADRLSRRGKKVVRVSKRTPLAAGVTVRDGAVIEIADGGSHFVAAIGGVSSLRGAHNAQNAAAAVAAVKAFGLSNEIVAAGLRSFPGLAHRLEEVGRIGHVLFFNDSKATNADAAENALAAFPRVYWIVGGRPKEGGIASLDRYFKRVAKAYVIGEAAEDFARTLTGGRVPTEIAGTLDAATFAAARDAAGDPAEEAIVLLSPACASFDQFRNFEHRGDAFRDLVRALGAVQSRAVQSEGEAA